MKFPKFGWTPIPDEQRARMIMRARRQQRSQINPPKRKRIKYPEKDK